jgi:YidC/Oxa1 family membrane protein insertase
LSFLSPLYDVVAWVIMRIHAVLAIPFGADSGAAWGLSIVLLVIFLRLIMLPLFVKQVRSQQRMQQHMPQLQEIRRKYKNDKQKLNEETMKYYKENGVNPLSGCLPLLAQFPVFISLFNVLKAVAQDRPQYGLTPAVLDSAKHARVFGVSLADTFLHSTTPWSVRGVILASVLISACTTFLTMWQSQRRGMMQQGPVDPDNPMAQSQKIMIYIAPLFALSGLYWQYGLVIYWVTNNLWTLGQQYFLFRNLPIVSSSTAGSAVAPSSGAKAAGTKASTTARPGGTARPSASATRPGAAAARTPAARATAARPAAGAKAAGARPAASPARPASAAQPARGAAPARSAQPVKARESGAKDAATKDSAAKDSAASDSAASDSAVTAARPPAPAAKAGTRSGVNGQARPATVSDSATQGSGRGRLFGRSKPEPEPAPAAEEKTVARQQPVRQTRSKRSGKR